MFSLEECREEINAIDKQMAELFVRRMDIVSAVAAYKKAHALPILDAAREEAVLEKGKAYIANTELHSYYEAFMRAAMAVSRQYQLKQIGE